MALSVAFGAALVLDPRTIDGAPAWLEPAKFAVSTAIYSFTLAWLLRFLPDRTTLRRIAGTATAAVFVIEAALIALQAARGTISHFNTRSVFDGAVFSVMGVSIAVQTLIAAAAAGARRGRLRLLAGWVSSLAFDLLTGVWETRESIRSHDSRR